RCIRSRGHLRCSGRASRATRATWCGPTATSRSPSPRATTSKRSRAGSTTGRSLLEPDQRFGQRLAHDGTRRLAPRDLDESRPVVHALRAEPHRIFAIARRLVHRIRLEQPCTMALYLVGRVSVVHAPAVANLRSAAPAEKSHQIVPPLRRQRMNLQFHAGSARPAHRQIDGVSRLTTSAPSPTISPYVSVPDATARSASSARAVASSNDAS